MEGAVTSVLRRSRRPRLRAARSHFARVPAKGFSSQCARRFRVAGVRDRASAALRSIQAPTVIITGDRDVTVSTDIHSRALAALLPHAKLVVLAGVGHMVHYVATDRVVQAIDELAAEAGAAKKR